MKKHITLGAIALLATLLLTACHTPKTPSVSDESQANLQETTEEANDSTEKILLGNIITMDENMPRAEAVAIRDGIIVAVGSEEEVRTEVSASAEVLDYTDQFIYPGFLEAHTHGMLAGQRAIGQANLCPVSPTNYEEYEEIIRRFIEENPDKEVYVAAGWKEDDTKIDHTFLDNILMDKPLIMNTDGGHSSLLNTKAMEVYGINEEAVNTYGTDLVRVDASGQPTGYICEEPAIDLLGQLPSSFSEKKDYILAWQEIALSEGITAVADAGADLLSKDIYDVYKELQDEGKLSLRTYAYVMTEDNEADAKGKVAEVVQLAEEVNGEYFKIIGLKAFLDGVIEAHTGWLLEDYSDDPGYHGVERFNDKEKMVNLIVEADKAGLSVHTHTIGDGAARFMLDCIETAEQITGNQDQRNVLAHLQLVAEDEIQKMADTNSIAVVAPLWTPSFSDEVSQEIKYIGQERSDNTYPIKSFVDAGATIAFHSDYPITPEINIPNAIFTAENRWSTEEAYGGEAKTKRNEKEGISRMEALEAVTINVAYAWHEEDRLGSITPGKIANFTVADTDFLECEKLDLPKATIMATIIDGNVVYKKE